MSDLAYVVTFFGIVFFVFVLFFAKDNISFLKKFLEDPQKRLQRRFENGEITHEEFQRRMEHLRACG